MPPTQANVPGRDFPSPEAPAESGLLEQPTLRIGPADARGRRPVAGPTGRLVGACHEQRRPWWLGWLGPTLAVYEAGDQPLVFSVFPVLSLGRRQVVRDAEGELVGSTDRQRLRDRWGRPLFRLRRAADGGAGEVIGAGGEVAARWSTAGGELTLDMRDGWLPGPFERMLALAAVLSG